MNKCLIGLRRRSGRVCDRQWRVSCKEVWSDCYQFLRAMTPRFTSHTVAVSWSSSCHPVPKSRDYVFELNDEQTKRQSIVGCGKRIGTVIPLSRDCA